MSKKNETERYMTTVKIGPKGQIVIPKEIRDMFSLQSGESMIIMADRERGIALHKQSILQSFADAVFSGQPTDYPVENPKYNEHFAGVIEKTETDGEVIE